jgi:SAM-dependent methyltransferase
MAHAAEERFASYYSATADRGPRETLLKALSASVALPARRRTAIDLGCGAGRDALPLLVAGWQVLAIDREFDALRQLRHHAVAYGPSLRLHCVAFERMRLPRAQLVNSSFALPLCRPERFGLAWRRLRRALLPGGRFAGQLFGPNDDWARPTPGKNRISIHTREQVLALLAGMAIEWLAEEESDATTPRGTRKHWHIFHIVARSKN